MQTSPARTRTLVFLLSGFMDCFFGGILLLFWLNLLSLDFLEFGPSRGWAGIIGAVMALSGVVVVTFQVTKLKEPEE